MLKLSVRTVLLIVATGAVLLNPLYIRSMRYDFWNVIPAIACLLIANLLFTSERGSGAGARPRGIGWPRAIFLFVMLLLTLEFGLRCFSYHRALQYQQQGDLLYTPIPGQEYVEKISLTHSRINSLGLRGVEVGDAAAKHIILCLGDSVTYGYGVDDEHTYPALLQRSLERQYPGQFVVLNGGVDAYPSTLMHRKFLSLWAQGVRPEIVIVGYSFNEGGAGQLIERDHNLRSRFVVAVRLKNLAHRIALYNLLVENWARGSYDRAKALVMRKSKESNASRAEMMEAYQHSLTRLTDDLRARQVTPVFVLFAGLNPQTRQFDVDAPFQIAFSEFAERSHVRVISSPAAFAMNDPTASEIRNFLLDQCHMNEKGSQALAEALAGTVPTLIEPNRFR